MMTKKNIYWQRLSINVEDRWKANGHKSCVVWFTGFSGSGKSALANGLSRVLHGIGVNSYILDGDNIRHGLNRDLGFNVRDRQENIRRTAEVSRLFLEAGLIVLTALISPYKADRQNAREIVKPGKFIEVFVKCPISECEKRDPKGMYKRAKCGQIREFTGISTPYEEPENPEIIIETDKLSINESMNVLVSYLFANGYIEKDKIRAKSRNVLCGIF